MDSSKFKDVFIFVKDVFIFVVFAPVLLALLILYIPIAIFDVISTFILEYPAKTRLKSEAQQFHKNILDNGGRYDPESKKYYDKQGVLMKGIINVVPDLAIKKGTIGWWYENESWTCIRRSRHRIKECKEAHLKARKLHFEILEAGGRINPAIGTQYFDSQGIAIEGVIRVGSEELIGPGMRIIEKGGSRGWYEAEDCRWEFITMDRTAGYIPPPSSGGDGGGAG